MAEQDGRITEFQVDMEADARTRAKLAEAGITKPEDLMSGRVDMGKASELLTNAAPEELSPLAAEKIMRDRDWAQQAVENEPPTEQPPPGEIGTEQLTRLDQLQGQLDASQKEVAKWKTYYGRSESRMGDVKTRVQELENKVASTQPYVDVRAMTGKDAEDPLTAGEVVNLLMSQSQALGNRLSQMKEELVIAARNPSEETIPADVEAELVHTHPWLTTLQLPQRERAMSDLLGGKTDAASVQGAPVPSAPKLSPTSAVIPESARAQVRQAAFIESSNKGSASESAAVSPDRSAYNQKVQELKAALDTKGGSGKAEELLASLGAGLADDSAFSFYKRR